VVHDKKLKSPDFDLFSDQEEYSEEEVAETMAETMEQELNYVITPLAVWIKIVDLFHIPNITIDQVMLRAFLMSLTGATSRWLTNKPSGSITTWEDMKTKFLRKYCPPARTAKKMEENNNFQQILDSRGAIPLKTAADVKVANQEMAEYSQKWHNRASRTRTTKTSDGLAAIQAQLNNLGREIKKVNEKVYAAQAECEQCKGPHYTKDFPLKEEGKTLEEAYYT
ncbi:hypothetical protein Tco_0828714, partial [Tanacetum coccineum]